MNYRLCILLLITISLGNCKDQSPCDLNANGLDCPTGDFDGDGIANADDIAPSDACQPSIPSFEENVIGTWDWAFSINGFLPGQIKINADGTYEDIEGAIIFNGILNNTEMTWSIADENITFNSDEETRTYKWKSYDCESFILEGILMTDINFTRI